MKQLLTILILVFASFSINAASSNGIHTSDYPLEKQSLNEEDWKDKKQDLDYSEIKERPKPKAKNDNFHFRNFDKPSSIFENSLTMQSVAIIIFAILIFGLLIWLLIGAKYVKNEKNKNNFSMKAFLASEGEDVNIIIETEIDKAIKEKDYTLAIRYIYLDIISSLSIKSYIIWKKDKTNYDYFYEMKSKNIETSNYEFFTEIYEHTWFGQKPVSEQDFNTIFGKFENYKSKLETSTL